MFWNLVLERNGIDGLDSVLLRLQVIEAQMKAYDRVFDSDNFTSVEQIMAQQNESSLDERFTRLAHETIESLHGFLKSHIAEQFESIFGKVPRLLHAFDTNLRYDFSFSHAPRDATG